MPFSTRTIFFGTLIGSLLTDTFLVSFKVFYLRTTAVKKFVFKEFCANISEQNILKKRHPCLCLHLT